MTRFRLTTRGKLFFIFVLLGLIFILKILLKIWYL